MNKCKGYSKMWFLVLLLVAFVAGCGSNSDDTVALSSAKAITACSLNGVTGTIDVTAKTISATMPYGTDVTTLVATFTTTGASVKVGTTTQISGTTSNDFTSPLAYIVTAADGTKATYTVTVSVALISDKAITAYSIDGVAGTINETAKIITVNLPYGTGVTALIATFTTTGTGPVTVNATEQISGTTQNDFTSPVAYIVTAADGTTATYTVTVTVAQISAKAITSYSLDGVAGTIDETAKTIEVNLLFGTDVTTLVATFTTTGASVKVGKTTQTSAATLNNFTSPVAYIVTAADGTTETYTVTVTVAQISTKAITAYSLAGFAGTINETAKTISVTMPNGTNVTTLVATYATTGTGVKVETTMQTSGTTPNDFTSPVAYIVTAADGTTATYTVTVTVASSSAKAITAYSFVGFNGFAGTINETAKTIVVNLPSGTNVTTLVATFLTTGTGVKVGTTTQTSAATLNDFTSPVAYIVTAINGTTATYTVTVSVAESSAKAITAYLLAGVTGTVDETAKTISVTMPNGTNVTALTATFLTTGTGVKVGTTTQISGTTPNNFTSPVAYIVTAADGTTATYTVTVTVAIVAPVPLGTAGNYAILAKTGVSTVPSSVVTGHVGLSPAARDYLTGWSESAASDASDTYSTSAQVVAPFKLFAADYVGGTTSADLTTAVGNMGTAYTDAAGRTATSAATTNVGNGTLTSLTLAPGVYEWGSTVTIPTDLTLNGSATDVWIFKVAGTLTMAAAKSVILSGGALPKNIFWQVSEGVTIGANTHFEGIILGQTSITFGNLASINGRLLAQSAVHLDATTVTQPAP